MSRRLFAPSALFSSWSRPVFTAAFLLAAQAATPAAAQSNDSTFYDSISSNPTSLFPLTNNDGVVSDTVGLLFENLLDRDPDTYDWIPQIANKWEISPDGKVFTFTIDPRAKFWDGSPVTAEDVKFSFDMVFFDGMRTADLRPYLESIAKVEVPAPGQVRFTTKDVYYKNFEVCAGLTIFQKKHYEKLIARDKTMTKAEVTKDPMGTGSWRIEKWDENQQIIFKRDPNYWDRSTLEKRGEWNAMRRVVRIIPERSVSFETFKRGDLTLHQFSAKEWTLNSDSPEFKDHITKVKTINKLAKDYGYLAWNNVDPILADKNVRWALSHLVNLPLWIKKFDFDLTEPTIGPYSPKSEQNDPSLKPVEFSLDLARKRLAAAGWTKAGKDGVLEKDGKRFELEIIYPVQSKDVAEPKLTEFKNTAAKVGISIQLKAVEWTSFTKLLDDRKFQGVNLAWQRGIDGDAKQIWHSASIANQGSNFVSYKNPEVDKLIDQHRQALDRAKRIELARQIQRLIYEDQPYTFLTEGRYTLYAHQNYVKKAKDTYEYTVGTQFWKLLPKP